MAPRAGHRLEALCEGLQTHLSSSGIYVLGPPNLMASVRIPTVPLVSLGTSLHLNFPSVYRRPQ